MIGPITLVVASALSAVAGATPALGETAPAPRLRHSQCLDPSMARTWIDLDRDTVLVDAGRYRYRLELASACTALRSTNFLSFRGDPIDGRVCGSIGEAILTRDYPCRIERIEIVSKDEYKQAVAERDAARKASREARKAAKAN